MLEMQKGRIFVRPFPVQPFTRSLVQTGKSLIPLAATTTNTKATRSQENQRQCRH